MLFPTIPLKMLEGLVHEGPDGCLSSGLKAFIVGCVQIGNSQLIHERFDNSRCDGAGHTGKGVYIHRAVKTVSRILEDAGYAQAGLGTGVKAKKIFFHKDFFKMADFMVSFDVEEGFCALVNLLLPLLLVEEVTTVTKDFLQLRFNGSEPQLLETESQSYFGLSQSIVAGIVDPLGQ